MVFSGIVQFKAKVVESKKIDSSIRLCIDIGERNTENLLTGASIAVNGVCLTVTKIEKSCVFFDVIEETLKKTNLCKLQKNDYVNIERSLKVGDEIGGHLLSGHIFGTVQIDHIDQQNSQCIIWFQSQPEWMKYLFAKGYVALEGVSLTLVDVNEQESKFSVHLIPETLKITTFSTKNPGDFINIEFDSNTKVIVDTIEKKLCNIQSQWF